jgi:hypothetical protein
MDQIIQPVLQKKRGLLRLPSELLILIILDVPSSDFQSLTQTCVELRQVIKINGAQICNNRLKLHYPESLKSLPTIIIDGWIVPTSMGYQSLETVGDLNITLSRPGPQFLRFLEDVSFGYELESDFGESESQFRGMITTFRRLSMDLALHSFLRAVNTEILEESEWIDLGKDLKKRGKLRKDLMWYFPLQRQGN